MCAELLRLDSLTVHYCLKTVVCSANQPINVVYARLHDELSSRRRSITQLNKNPAPAFDDRRHFILVIPMGSGSKLPAKAPITKPSYSSALAKLTYKFQNEETDQIAHVASLIYLAVVRIREKVHATYV